MYRIYYFCISDLFSFCKPCWNAHEADGANRY